MTWNDLAVQGHQGSHQPGKSGRVRESQGILGGQGKSGKSEGILDGVREKEEKKKKREINIRTRNKKRMRNMIYNIDIYYIIRSEFYRQKTVNSSNNCR